MVLNLNWEIIWVFVDLLILFLLMKKFLFGPVTKLLDQRAKGVTDTIEQAESQLAQAQQQKQAYTQQLAQARGEAAHILDQARKQAELNYNRRMEEAAQDVRRLNERAARQRQADQEAMLAETRRQVAGLVLLTTAKVSQRTLDGETDQAMLDELLEEVGNEP
ncbi:MAG: F0F1 ATP synthase subunit B [Clostridiales bacterium]|nr:F0F1 ATP synthase subunit B [Clostridiales bacterium]